MKINKYTNNSLELQGRIANINEYSEGKAANITLAVENGKDKDGASKDPVWIQLKSFTPAAYNVCRTGMYVRIYGHVTPNKYDKNGETVYSQDLIADFVDFLESKGTVEQREAIKAYNNAE